MRWIPRRTVISAFVTLLVPIVAGCDLLTADPEFNLRVELESDRIVLPSEGPAVIHFVVTNRGSSTAHVSRCGGEIVSWVERREDGAWTDVRVTACRPNLNNHALLLEPGASAPGSRFLDGAGTYRLQIWASGGSGGDSTRSVSSSPFTLQKPSP